jgi:hypothetical protein
MLRSRSARVHHRSPCMDSRCRLQRMSVNGVTQGWHVREEVLGVTCSSKYARMHTHASTLSNHLRTRVVVGSGGTYLITACDFFTHRCAHGRQLLGGENERCYFNPTHTAHVRPPTSHHTTDTTTHRMPTNLTGLCDNVESTNRCMK